MSPSSPPVALVIDPATLVGGAERFMAETLSAAKSSGWSFVVAGNPHPDYLALFPDNVTHYPVRLPSLRMGSLRDLYRLWWVIRQLHTPIRRLHPTVIVGNSVRGNIVAALCSLRYGIPAVWILHEFGFAPWPFRWLSGIPRSLIAVSTAIQEYYLPRAKPAARKRFQVLPNGIDPETARQRAQATLPWGEKPTDATWVGIVGRIEAWKGQSEFLDVAERVARHQPGTQFFIVGSPAPDERSQAYAQSLRQRAQQGILSERVRFVTLPDALPLIGRLDLILHCATQPEPFGRTVIEAMALGCPVIASSAGGPVSIITDGVDGYLRDPHDIAGRAALAIQLLSDTKQRTAIGRAAMETVAKRYTLASVADRLVTILSQAALGPRG